MPRLLSDHEIRKKLRGLDGWSHRGRFITKSFPFRDFMEGIEFVDRVAAIAEAEEHHPDIRVRYTRVTLSLQTHSEGGVTDWDLRLASTIERVIRRVEEGRRDGGSR